MKKIVSGLQATNSLTIGNYIGSIKNILDLQDKNDLYIFIADLHSITTPFSPIELDKNRKSIAALYKACGIDFKKNKIFYQSSVLEHAQLAYILICHTNLGELNRMTQFKSKSVKNSNKTEMIPTGLLIYPCLMAADILLYDADIVPVGDDQKQHIELTKNLANRFNKKYEENIFKIPEFFSSKIGGRIMDLQNPLIKMSKSNIDKRGTLFLLDDEKETFQKIMSAKTDSLNKVKFDIKNQPGISNLLKIYSSLTNLEIKIIEKKYINKNYKEFKNDLANILISFNKDIQKKYFNILGKKDIETELLKNSILCKKEASKKINKIHKVIGLSYE